MGTNFRKNYKDNSEGHVVQNSLSLKEDQKKKNANEKRKATELVIVIEDKKPIICVAVSNLPHTFIIYSPPPSYQ